MFYTCTLEAFFIIFGVHKDLTCMYSVKRIPFFDWNYFPFLRIGFQYKKKQQLAFVHVSIFSRRQHLLNTFYRLSLITELLCFWVLWKKYLKISSSTCLESIHPWEWCNGHRGTENCQSVHFQESS